MLRVISFVSWGYRCRRRPLAPGSVPGLFTWRIPILILILTLSRRGADSGSREGPEGFLAAAADSGPSRATSVPQRLADNADLRSLIQLWQTPGYTQAMIVGRARKTNRFRGLASRHSGRFPVSRSSRTHRPTRNLCCFSPRSLTRCESSFLPVSNRGSRTRF